MKIKRDKRGLDYFIRLKDSRLRSLFDRPTHHFEELQQLPRTIWTYWDSGEENAPELVRFCLRYLRATNPGWQVNVLDNQRVADFADLSDLDKIGLPIQKRANVLRTRLILQYGGVWCDATLLCTTPFDAWLFQMMQSSAFFFSRPGEDRIVSNWFIAGQKASPLLKQLDKTYTQFLSRQKKYNHESQWLPYYNHHYTIEWLAMTHRRFRKEFTRMPKISSVPAVQLQLALESGTPPALDQLYTVPVHKLNWRTNQVNECLENTARALAAGRPRE